MVCGAGPHMWQQMIINASVGQRHVPQVLFLYLAEDNRTVQKCETIKKRR